MNFMQETVDNYSLQWTIISSDTRMSPTSDSTFRFPRVIYYLYVFH
jgi:hypothetical protein